MPKTGSRNGSSKSGSGTGRSRSGSERASKGKRDVSPAEFHQTEIAKRTLKMPQPILGVMGGMTKEEAVRVLKGYGYTDADIAKFMTVTGKHFEKKDGGGKKTARAEREPEPEPDRDDDIFQDAKDPNLWFLGGKVYFQGSGEDLLKKMDEEQYWPNVWTQEERGDNTLLTRQDLLRSDGQKKGDGHVINAKLDQEAGDEVKTQISELANTEKNLGEMLRNIESEEYEANLDPHADDADEIAAAQYWFDETGELPDAGIVKEHGLAGAIRQMAEGGYNSLVRNGLTEAGESLKKIVESSGLPFADDPDRIPVHRECPYGWAPHEKETDVDEGTVFTWRNLEGRDVACLKVKEYNIWLELESVPENG